MINNFMRNINANTEEFISMSDCQIMFILGALFMFLSFEFCQWLAEVIDERFNISSRLRSKIKYIWYKIRYHE